MPSTITFPSSLPYTRSLANGETIWMPWVDVTYEADSGRRHRTSALVDSGATWSSIPEEIAINRLHIDLTLCERKRIRGISGIEEVPCQDMTVSLLGRSIRCTILFTKGDLYLLGHVPIFSNFLFAFEENQQPGSYRLLYKP